MNREFLQTQIAIAWEEYCDEKAFANFNGHPGRISQEGIAKKNGLTKYALVNWRRNHIAPRNNRK